MALQACLRCGSTDLALPDLADGVFLEGSQLSASTCRACGLTGAPVEFPDRAAHEEFRAARAVLYNPERPPPLPALTLEPPPPSPPTMIRGWVRGVAALVGFVFVIAAALALLTAAQLGGDAWGELLPSAVFALLMGAPMLALAGRR